MRDSAAERSPTRTIAGLVGAFLLFVIAFAWKATGNGYSWRGGLIFGAVYLCSCVGVAALIYFRRERHRLRRDEPRTNDNESASDSAER
jgi:hypothetical protein